MYVTDGWGTVYKIDAHGGRGQLVWKMDPKTDHDWAGAIACCGVDNRGVALAGNLVISHTLDGRLIATDRRTGRSPGKGRSPIPTRARSSPAPRSSSKNMVITGVAGAEYGIRGWIAATDLKTRKEVWRTYTIPEGEPGSDSWRDDRNAAASGGGSTWVTEAMIPRADTIIWGVGNPGPDWDNQYRPGDNLYTDSSLGLDADSGKIKWHFQHTPNDPFDYDSVSENVLVDVAGAGGTRKARPRGRPQRLRLCDRSHQRQVCLGPALREERDLDQGTRCDIRQAGEYDPERQVQHYVASITPSRDTTR